MGVSSRRFLAILLTAILFLAPGAAVAEDADPADCNHDGKVDDFEASQDHCPETRAVDDHDDEDVHHEDELDCNKDGKIDDRERTFTTCPSPTGDRCEPTLTTTCGATAEEFEDRCDLNGDGHVGPREAEACKQATAADEDGDLKDRCDFDRDGEVGPREAEACKQDAAATDGRLEGDRPAPMHCDTDGDGAVDEAEKKACAEDFRKMCDFDDSGRVDEFERKKCAESHDEFRMTAVSDECRAALKANEEERRAFHEAGKAKWESFDAEQRAKVEEFGSEQHAEAEWEAFRKEQREERRAFEGEMRAEHDEFEGSLEKPADCEGRGGPGPQCTPDAEAYEHFKGILEEDERRFETETERRIAAFEERQTDALERAESGKLNETALDELKERLERDRARFEGELEEARARHARHMEERWTEFNEHAGRACTEGDGPRMAEPGRIHADVRQERFECKLDMQAHIDAFYEEHGSDASAWDEQAETGYIALKTELRAATKACESRLHEAWKGEVKERFRNLSGEQRFGRFVVEEEDDGGSVAGRFVAFEWELGSLTLRDYTVQGLLLFEEFYAPHDQIRHEVKGSTIEIRGVYDDPDAALYVEGEEVEAEAEADAAEDADEKAAEEAEAAEEAAEAAAEDEAATENATESEEVANETTAAKSFEGFHLRVKIHDAPPGGIDLVCAMRDEVDMAAASGGPQACFLTLADGAEVTAAEDNEEKDEEGTRHYRVALGEQNAVLRVHGPHHWDDDMTTLEFYGAAGMLVPSENFVHEFANKHREEINAAVEDDDVLVEVDVVADESGEADAESTDLSDDEAEVEVEEPEAGDGVTVTVDAEASAGKTGVFNVDSDLFDVEDLSLVAPDDFTVKYWDVADDGTKTEVEIGQADSLADVLDPSEDAPEYWVVLDKDGVQLIVSFPHFSTHQVQIQSARVTDPDGSDMHDGASKTPSPGAVGVLGAVAAAALVGLARRKK